MSISLLLVVHNEEQRLYEFLMRHAPLCDEVVLVDQASSDGTVREFLRAVVDCGSAWTLVGDKHRGFSEASNNLALDHCGKEWVLVLFPDEKLTGSAIADLPKFVSDANLDGVAFLRDTYLDAHPLILGERTLRLVRRDKVFLSPLVHHDPECTTGKVLTLGYTGIEHRKTRAEQDADNLRYFNLAGSEGVM